MKNYDIDLPEYLGFIPHQYLFWGGGGGGGSTPAVDTSGYDKAIAAYQAAVAQAREDVKPWREAGTWAVGEYKNLLDPESGIDRTEYLRSTPGYQFADEQAQKAINNAANASGSFGSGAWATGLSEDARKRGDSTYNNYLAQLANLSGSGQSAATNSGQYSMQGASQIGQAYTDQSNLANQAAYNAYNARQSAYANNQNTLMGGIGLLGGLGLKAYEVFSDKRAKKNVKNMDMEGGNALMVLDKLNPKTFDYKPEYGPPDQAGFVAQDLENSLPEAVSKNDDGMRMVNPMAINALLVKAIQEQQGQIEELRNSLDVGSKKRKSFARGRPQENALMADMGGYNG